MKICWMEARFFHVDMWTDMTELVFTWHCCFVNTHTHAQSSFHLHFFLVIPVAYCTGMQSVYVACTVSFINSVRSNHLAEMTLCHCLELSSFLF
jgi:hypothetical protein